MVKIGPSLPARQRGEMWRSNAVIFYFLNFFYRISCRLWRIHFCIDRHRFCASARWRVSVGIDFLGGLIVRVKIFPLLNPQNLKFLAHFGLGNFRPKPFTMGTLRSKLPLIIIVAPWKLYSKRQIGVKVSKFMVTWHSACAMAIFVYLTLLNIIMAVKQEIVNVDTSNLSHC